nr:MAG TPA: hypothetical protein [Caudoviricetes sp.]
MYKRVIKRKSMENRLLNKIEDTQYWVKEAILTLMLTRLEMENFDHLFLDMLGRLRNGKWVNADTMLALVLSQRLIAKRNEKGTTSIQSFLILLSRYLSCVWTSIQRENRAQERDSERKGYYEKILEYSHRRFYRVKYKRPYKLAIQNLMQCIRCMESLCVIWELRKVEH